MCEDTNSKLFDVFTVADIDDEDLVGNSLLQISKLRFGQKAKLLFRLCAQGLVKILKLKFRQAGVWSVFCRWYFVEVMTLCLWQCFFNTSLWHQDRHLKRLNSHEKESTNQNHRLKSLNLKSSICRTALPPDVFSLKFPFWISDFTIWFCLMHFVNNNYLLSYETHYICRMDCPRRFQCRYEWKVQLMCLKLKKLWVQNSLRCLWMLFH